jgi:hypothetical protein
MIAAAVKPPPDLTSFYGAFTPLCFTLLGLWLVVVQTRHSEWRYSPFHRRRAVVLALNFAFPGTMGLLSLVDPGNQTLWRAAFACVALAAVVILTATLIRGSGGGQHSLLAALTTTFVVVLYGAIALVALAPKGVKNIGIRLTPLEVEELLLSALVFIAVNVAWLLMFDDVGLDESGKTEAQPATQREAVPDALDQ